MFGLVLATDAGRAEVSSFPSAMKPKVIVGMPSGIKGIGASCDAEAAILQPAGDWREVPW